MLTRGAQSSVIFFVYSAYTGLFHTFTRSVPERVSLAIFKIHAIKFHDKWLRKFIGTMDLERRNKN